MPRDTYLLKKVPVKVMFHVVEWEKYRQSGHVVILAMFTLAYHLISICLPARIFISIWYININNVIKNYHNIHCSLCSFRNICDYVYSVEVAIIKIQSDSSTYMHNIKYMYIKRSWFSMISFQLWKRLSRFYIKVKLWFFTFLAWLIII